MMLRNVLLVLFVVGLGVAQENTPDFERIDCYPGLGADESKCLARGCIWRPAEIDGLAVPWCFLPSNYGYKSQADPVFTPNGFSVTLTRATTASYVGSDSPTIYIKGEFQSNYRLRITITDGTPRFEVPLQISPATGGNSNPLYEVQTSNEPVFSLKVIRKSSGAVLFDSSLGGLTFADQFLQISTKLPSRNLYGIGENEQTSFRHKFDKFYTWPLFARDQPPDYDANMYGVHPHYTVLENDGNTHAVVIVNSNAQEFVTLPAPGLLYRTIGGILDIYMFLGPKPEDVVSQYTEAVGRAEIPPYWSLGFQICKYGYNSLDNMQMVVDRTKAAGIPQDVQYGDIDIMERELDFTVSQDRFNGLTQYVKELKTKGIKFVTILDPCISIGEPAGTYRPYDLGNEMDVWVKKADGLPVVGKVWPADPVFFPDFSKNVTRTYWIQLVKEFKQLIDFDGLWIDMNEPANFVTGDINEGCATNKWNNPPYVPGIRGGELQDKTLCPDHVDSFGRHYDTHNLYGWSESEPTQAGVLAAQEGKRAVVLSRSTFLGSGKWVAHWLGDNWSRWTNLRFSIIGMLQFNQFGIPFVGSDICGFIGDTTAEMCQRWLELGAFYPFSRNHNGLGYIDQDPASFGPEVADSTRRALEIRYTLLPHLYTLFYFHKTRGNTVARPLWHEFPIDKVATGIDSQFLWGEGFMVSAVLEEGRTNVDIYFPEARWFDYYTGAEVSTHGNTVNLGAPLDYVHLHFRGGFIYPTQEPALNTELSRQNPFGLTVALDENDRAEGYMYYDDGESTNSLESGAYYFAKYIYENGEVETIVEHNGYPRMRELKLQTLRLLGSKYFSKATVIVKGERNAREIKFTRSAAGEIILTDLNLNPTKAFKIKFE